MSLSQADDQQGWAFHTWRGGIDAEMPIFVPGLRELGNNMISGNGNYRPRMRRVLDVVPRENARRALAP